MAQTARNEAEKATNAAQTTADDGAELGRQTAARGAEVMREAVEKTRDTARSAFQTAQRTAGAMVEAERAVARRSIERVGEFSQAFKDLLGEQTRDSVEAFRALSGTVDWNQAARIQSEFLRVSLERSAELTHRYFEVVQAVISSAAASATKDQAHKAA